LIQEISKRKNLFCDDYKKQVENKTLLKKWFLEINKQIDLTLVVQTEAIVFFLGNQIKFYSAVLIFGSRSMVALPIGPQPQDFGLNQEDPSRAFVFRLVTLITEKDRPVHNRPRSVQTSS